MKNQRFLRAKGVTVVLALLGCHRGSAPTPAQVPGVEGRVRSMREHVAASPELRRLNDEEARFQDVRQQVLEPWRRSWMQRQPARYGALVDGGALTWASANRALRRERDGLREFDWQLTAGGSPADEATRYLAGFQSVEDFRLDVHRMVPAGDGYALDVNYDLRGRVSAGGRRHDRGMLSLTVARRGGAWRITGASPTSMESVESARAPGFEVATAATGLDRVPVAHRNEAIRRGGYALAVADFDGDDRADVLVGNEGPVQLFRNTGGRYEEVSAAVGLRGETRVKSAVFADFDGDGQRDLVMLRFVDRATDGDDLSVYRNDHGRFVPMPNALPRTQRYDRGMPLAVADFDGNGTLDLYLGFPGARDFTNNLAQTARGGGLVSQGLWLNQGAWRFTESTADSALSRDRDVYPHATLVADFNHDGHSDLLVVDDSGRVSPVYRNDGHGAFRNVTESTGLVAAGWSMGAAAGDYDGDGDTDVVTTHVDLLDGVRMAASAQGRETNPALAQRLSTMQREQRGSLLFRNRGDGTFDEVSAAAGLGWVGEGAAGAEWVDYNNDGQLDVYVANGLWSGGEQEFSSLFLRTVLLGNNTGAWESMDEVTGQSTFAPRRAEPNPILTVLREFRGDLAVSGRALAAGPSLSMAGDQRNRLFRNNGDGSFTEVGYLEGADRAEDGYVVATADYDSDGRQDLMLRHCDPAPGRNFESLTVLRNVGANQHSLRVSARGTDHGIDGFGATVTAWVGDRRIVREIRAVSGAVQGEPAAFIGLGTADRADRVEIRWPGGATQVQQQVPAGRVVFREVSTATRVAAR